MSTETDGVAMWWAAACEKGAAVGESGEESGVAEQITISLKSVGHRQLSFTHTRVAFNRDRKHYTPAFLPRSQQPSPALERSFLSTFQQHLAEAKPSSAPILVARPPSSRCQLCHENYSDYLKHITHAVHVSNVEKASLNTYFSDLQDLLKKSEPLPNSEPRKRRKVEVDVVGEEKEENSTVDGSEGDQESAQLFQQFSKF